MTVHRLLKPYQKWKGVVLSSSGQKEPHVCIKVNGIVHDSINFDAHQIIIIVVDLMTLLKISCVYTRFDIGSAGLPKKMPN